MTFLTSTFDAVGDTPFFCFSVTFLTFTFDIVVIFLTSTFSDVRGVPVFYFRCCL